MKKLFFKESEKTVTIGVNIIPKLVYIKHKEAFDRIINFEDIAWNETISNIELLEFIEKLDAVKLRQESKLAGIEKDSGVKEMK